MADVSTFEDVNLPADTVWSVIGDFGGIRKWAVLVQGETVEDTAAAVLHFKSGALGTLASSHALASARNWFWASVYRRSISAHRSRATRRRWTTARCASRC